MIGDEERREVAHELREMVGARCYGRPGATGSCVDIDDFLTALLDRRVRDCEVSIDSIEALRVADLIDVPDAGTCRNLATKPADELLCSRCGEHVDIAYMESADDYHARYCPNCGAEVVDK